MSCKKTVPGKNAINCIFKSVVIIFVLFSFSLDEKNMAWVFRLKSEIKFPFRDSTGERWGQLCNFVVHKCLHVNPPKIFDDGDKYDFQSQWLF